MPFVSKAQAAYFHANEGKKPGITHAVVKEFDKASAHLKLPAKVQSPR